jgi:hypothetical protein
VIKRCCVRCDFPGSRARTFDREHKLPLPLRVLGKVCGHGIQLISQPDFVAAMSAFIPWYTDRLRVPTFRSKILLDTLAQFPRNSRHTEDTSKRQSKSGRIVLLASTILPQRVMRVREFAVVHTFFACHYVLYFRNKTGPSFPRGNSGSNTYYAWGESKRPFEAVASSTTPGICKLSIRP